MLLRTRHLAGSLVNGHFKQQGLTTGQRTQGRRQCRINASANTNNKTSCAACLRVIREPVHDVINNCLMIHKWKIKSPAKDGRTFQ
jgi:hypothetical protein